MALANPPPAIEGQVAEARYHIDRTSYGVNPIEHGWIRLGDDPFEVEASFLYFKTQEEATEVHRNLLRLKGESFLRSHFVIKSQMNVAGETNGSAQARVYKLETCFWVAVEKINNTLDEYRRSKQPFFGTGKRTRLLSQYQNIIRDIIRGMCQIHQEENLTHGVLQSKNVVIIKERAKFAYITNSHAGTPATDFTSLQRLFQDVLGQVRDIPDDLKHFPDIANVKEELKDFLHHSGNVNNGTNLRRLYFHPLLMSCGERLLLVVRANTRLRYRRRSLSEQISDYIKEYGKTTIWTTSVTEVAYTTVLYEGLESRDIEGNKTRRAYKDESWDQFLFGRNTIVHINDNIRRANEEQKRRAQQNAELQVKSEADVERDLSSMFPKYFIRVYGFFKLEEITPSLWLHMGEHKLEIERTM